MRSSWKLIPTELPILRRSIILKMQKDDLKIWVKGFLLFSDLSDKKVSVYNGGRMVDFEVKKEMLASAAGCFALTKRITAAIHNKTKRNKRGRLNKHKGK